MFRTHVASDYLVYDSLAGMGGWAGGMRRGGWRGVGVGGVASKRRRSESISCMNSLGFFFPPTIHAVLGSGMAVETLAIL